ncbi:response regulator transcription factor [Spirosoma fluviale]|uniref:DNA-binding response regulator, OmpR family, contains REC and winged-helix (WHTH) domain n=1 Tax=Spirosoma fluviale TaxID=1597977 RepID=A0A286FFI4_9BACT|nr:response regulator transcription factor [Spirosoma fluviale]SOD81739.1 DNA-binding response regulator, OmpR family, contains REC and winged-helix (wHTH) domain [Spirosoma fluviale]
MRSILIIEDDRRIAQNISRSLRVLGYSTEVAYDGFTGRGLGLTGQYELIILDINLPDINGYEICRNLRAEHTTLPIIMLTAMGEIEDKVEGLECGADDYIVKPFDLRELSARVATCFRRSDLLVSSTGEEVLQLADLTLNTTSKIVQRQNTLIELTAKEFALLEYLMRNQGRVVSKIDLAEKVWNFNFDPGTNVVEVYINYLRKKIDREFTVKLIHTRPGLGYTLKAN